MWTHVFCIQRWYIAKPTPLALSLRKRFAGNELTECFHGLFSWTAQASPLLFYFSAMVRASTSSESEGHESCYANFGC